MNGNKILIKIENFRKSLAKFENADFTRNDPNDFYCEGVLLHFSLTFELAWKALKEVMKLHKISEADTGSPREILKAAYKTGFIHNENLWLLMADARNILSHVYNEDNAQEYFNLLRDDFIPELKKLLETLEMKITGLI